MTESSTQETGRDRNFWLSWYSPTPTSEFELHSPWWVSGYDTDDRYILVAAVRATNEEAAFAAVRAAYDNRHGPIEERFIKPLGPDGPFSDRFPRAGWMAWDEQRTCGCPAHSNPTDVMCTCTRWDYAKDPTSPDEHVWEPGEGKCPDTPPRRTLPSVSEGVTDG